ncbi:MAG: PAS domain S-box protein [Deltaproteobacteria bacterium]|nr:PAS domain S-box protein [Deltaproteobacteria bacterium]
MMTKSAYKNINFIWNFLKYKLLIIAAITAVLLISTNLLLKSIKEHHRDDAAKELVYIRDSTIATYHFWLDNRKKAIRLLADNREIVTTTQKLLAENESKYSYNLNSENLKTIRKLLMPPIESNNDLGFFIIDKNRISIGSMRDSNMWTKNLIAIQKPDMLDKVFNGETILISGINSDVPLKKRGVLTNNISTTYIASPIKIDNQIVAVLTLRIDTFNIFSQIAKFGRQGRTFETYAIDERGVMLTESRFAHQIKNISNYSNNESMNINFKITDPGGCIPCGFKPKKKLSEYNLTRMAASLTKGKTETDIHGYSDYRGVKVLGAWKWDKNLSMGIVSEIDVSEVDSRYLFFKQIINLILTAFLILTLSTLLILYLYKKSHLESIAKREQSLSDLLDALPIIIYAVNNENKIILGNSLCAESLGVTKKQLLHQGNLHEKISHGNYNEIIKLAEQNTMGIHREFKTANGDDKVLNITHVPFVWYDSDYTTVLTVATDITNIVALKKKLRIEKHNAEIANKTKSNFIHNLNHEIRTPMNIIAGNLHILKNGNIDSKGKLNIEKIEKSTKSLLKIIQNVLELSSIADNTLILNKSSFSINAILIKLLNSIKKEATPKGIAVHYLKDNNIPEHLVGDSKKIEQIIEHLLDNALKFTETGAIVLKLKAAENSDDKVFINITIEDTGIGISEEFKNIIFDVFTQLDEELNRKYSGTGLGLALCKQLAESMGGTITVESTEGKGTLFSLTIPFELANHTHDSNIMNSIKIESETDSQNNLSLKHDLSLSTDELIKQLETKIKLNDLEAKQLAAVLLHKMTGTATETICAEMQESLNIYDFAKAEELIKKLTLY